MWQRGTSALVIRRIQRHALTCEELNLPAEVLKRLMVERYGLVLVTGSTLRLEPRACPGGSTGSGKSTTIAFMLEHVNRSSAPAGAPIMCRRRSARTSAGRWPKRSPLDGRDVAITCRSYRARSWRATCSTATD